MIDNCVHWLTGTRPGSSLYDLWNAVGVLGPEVELRRKPMFFSAELNGQKLTFWRDKERTRQEMLALSPEDAKEIHKLMDYVTLAETMSVPLEKPFDAMNLLDYMKLGMSMKSMGKVMKEYGRMDIQELAEKAMEQLCKAYPVLHGKIRILDIWTPMTYRRWCNSYSGAYMSFVVTKGAKETRVRRKTTTRYAGEPEKVILMRRK